MRRLVLAVLLVSSGAAARSVTRTSGGGADLQVTAVRGELAGPIATFRVSYVSPIEEPGYGITGDLEIPASALVTAATVRQDGTKRRLDLVRAEQASTRWEALAADSEEPPTKQAPGARRSAVMIAGGPGLVTVSIASPRTGRVELELELATPTCFFKDARHVLVPATWVRHLPSRVAKPADELTDACGLAGDGTWLAFASTEIARRPSGDRLAAFAGRLVAGEDHIVRVEIDLASVLADIPRDLATVLVVDGSRSMTNEQRKAQRELVAAYLRAAKDTRVQVIAYARTAGALLPSWSVASRATARVDRELRGLAPRNGSNLDAGLEQAGAWLSQIAGTRRVVLVTDELMASRLEQTQPATLKRSLPAGTLVHVVSTVGGSDGIVRDDEIALAPLAAATDGIAVRVHHSDDRPLDATILVRPISVDQLVVTAPGWSPFEPSPELATCVEDLTEGHSCTWWGRGDVTSGPVAIEGLVWGTRITRVVRPDPSHALELARELSLSSSLEPDLVKRTSPMARGVNDQWAMYGEWGGTGRYLEGFGYGISNGGCCSGSSLSSHPSINLGTIGTRHREPDDLSIQLAPAVAACQLGDERASVRIEMTLLEIVDVQVDIEGRKRTHPNELRKLRTCVEDVIWDASLMLSVPLASSHHTATFGNP